MDKILIFLSRPNPFIEIQQKFLEQLKKKLSEKTMLPVSLQAANYDLTDSINYISGIIKQCYGIIIVGFKQYFIEKGCKKKGGKLNENYDFYFPEEINVSNQGITSPFCHIEGTIGILNNLPMFILNEKTVREEGVIQGGRFSIKAPGFRLTDEKEIVQYFTNEDFKQLFDIWYGKVLELYRFLNLKKI